MCDGALGSALSNRDRNGQLAEGEFVFSLSVKSFFLGQSTRSSRLVERSVYYGPQQLGALIAAVAAVGLQFVVLWVFHSTAPFQVGAVLCAFVLVGLFVEHALARRWGLNVEWSLVLHEVMTVVFLLGSPACVIIGSMDIQATCLDAGKPSPVCAQSAMLIGCLIVVGTPMLRLSMPRWHVLQQLETVLMALLLNVDASADPASVRVRRSVATGVALTGFLATVATWIGCRASWESFADLENCKFAVATHSKRLNATLPRMVQLEAVEAARWLDRHTVAFAGDSFLACAAVSPARLDSNDPAALHEHWCWREQIAMLFAEVMGQSSPTLSRRHEAPCHVTTVAVGDVLCAALRRGNDGGDASPSTIAKDAKGFVKLVQKFQTQLAKIQAVDQVAAIIHRGFVALASLGYQAVQYELYGAGAIEAIKCLALCQPGEICATQTVAHLVKDQESTQCRETLKVWTNPIAMDVVALRSSGRDEQAEPTGVADCENTKRRKPDRKEVRIVVGDGPSASATSNCLQDLMDLAARHTDVRGGQWSHSTQRMRRALYCTLLEQDIYSCVVMRFGCVPRFSAGAMEWEDHEARFQSFLWSHYSRPRLVVGALLCCWTSTATAALSILLLFDRAVSLASVIVALAALAVDGCVCVAAVRRKMSSTSRNVAIAGMSALSWAVSVAAVLVGARHHVLTVWFVALLRLMSLLLCVVFAKSVLLCAGVAVAATATCVAVAARGSSFEYIPNMITFLLGCAAAAAATVWSETSSRRAYLRTNMAAAATQELAQAMRFERLCVEQSCGKEISSAVLRLPALKLRSPAMFPHAVVLALTVPRIAHVFRSDIADGLTQLHSLRCSLDRIAEAFGAERLNVVCSGDAVCYVNRNGDLSSSELNCRRARGVALIRKSPTVATTLEQSTRFMIEMWYTMQRCVQDMCQRGAQQETPVSTRQPGGRISPAPEPVADSEGLAVDLAATLPVRTPSVAFSTTAHAAAVPRFHAIDGATVAAIAEGCMLSGLSALDHYRCAPHHTGPALQTVLPLMALPASGSVLRLAQSCRGALPEAIDDAAEGTVRTFSVFIPQRPPLSWSKSSSRCAALNLMSSDLEQVSCTVVDEGASLRVSAELPSPAEGGCCYHAAREVE